MPRAEAGTTKALNNKLKSKGLQRLRWYCQACERQMRDENGFKCHTQSEGHVRQMLLIGEDSRKYINDFSGQFQRDFVQQLRTAHGEKKILINHFYQEYIANKEHVHMNSTRWPSLTEFAKFLGREGICRVEDTDKGLQVAWIDNSPEALRRQDAIRKKDRQDKGDEEREQRLIREQVERAKLDAEEKGDPGSEDQVNELKRADGESIKLSFGPKEGSLSQSQQKPAVKSADDTPQDQIESSLDQNSSGSTISLTKPLAAISLPAPSKSKNVFSSQKKKAGSSLTKTAISFEPPKKPMSEAERIMKEEMKRKGINNASRGIEPPSKRHKVY